MNEAFSMAAESLINHFWFSSLNFYHPYMRADQTWFDTSNIWCEIYSQHVVIDELIKVKLQFLQVYPIHL